MFIVYVYVNLYKFKKFEFENRWTNMLTWIWDQEIFEFFYFIIFIKRHHVYIFIYISVSKFRFKKFNLKFFRVYVMIYCVNIIIFIIYRSRTLHRIYLINNKNKYIFLYHTFLFYSKTPIEKLI